MTAHWHHCSWEIDPTRHVTHRTTMLTRPPVTAGQVSFVAEPASPLWQQQGHGAYRVVSGRYEFAHVVWRCADAGCQPRST
jgi:hypothetical protein